MAKERAAEISMCGITGRKPSAKRSNKTSFYKHKGDFRWTGVKDEPYKDKGTEWSNIIRRVLIGGRGETANFHVRYFEISANGSSSLELHRHEHVVICVKGKGVVLTGRKKRTIGFMDTVYISPNTVHQLSNPYQEPFGFFCVVNSRRDRPRVLRK
jgi:quercetin dioxygenase-like cupin family protein